MFNFKDHYWRVAGETRVYSSDRAAFVGDDDADYLAWVERAKGTYGGDITARVATLAELRDVLLSVAPGGIGPDIPMPQITVSHIAWIEAALARTGRLQDVQNAVSSQGGEASALWRRVSELAITDRFVVNIANALSIDLPALFNLADTIRREVRA